LIIGHESHNLARPNSGHEETIMKNDETPQVAELDQDEISEVAGGFSIWDWYFGRGGAGAKDA